MRRNSVFISYRREGGSELARSIKDSMEKRKFKVFLDIEDLRKGPFPIRIYDQIEKSSDLIAVLTPDSLDRCWAVDDWVRKEIAHAIKTGKNVVPVIHRNFKWPDRLPPEIEPLRNYHGLPSSHEFFEASMDKLANLLSGRRIPWAKLMAAGLSACAALIIAAYIFMKPTTEICDQYLCIEILEKSVGTLISEKPYDLKLTIKNRTSTEMFVSDVLVNKYNAEAAKQMGMSSDLIHIGKFHGPIPIPPHQQKEVSIVGNEILPMKADVTVLHSLSGKASEFKITLPAEMQNMPEPRILPKNAIYDGMDGISAIKTAVADARAWSSDAHVVAAYPAESSEILEPLSKLKTQINQNWVVTLFSPRQDKYYTAIIQNDHIIEKKMYFGEGKSRAEDRNQTPIPAIGNQRALELVSDNRLICGNWKSLRLANIQVGSKWSLAWFLPYRGADSLPLIVDAVTGDLLTMGGKTENFKKVRSLL